MKGIPYRTGDVVQHKNGTEHIIHEVSFNEYPDFTYSTDRGAWYYHDDFKLISEATPESVAKLVAALNQDYEEFSDSDSDNDVDLRPGEDED